MLHNLGAGGVTGRQEGKARGDKLNIANGGRAVINDLACLCQELADRNVAVGRIVGQANNNLQIRGRLCWLAWGGCDWRTMRMSWQRHDILYQKDNFQ